MSAHPFSRVPTFSNALFSHYLPAKSFPARVPWREKIWQNAFRSGLNRRGKGGSSAMGKDTREGGNRLIDAISTARSPLDSFPIPVGETR